MLIENEVKELMLQWAESFSSGDTDKICSLYDDNAILLGTVSPDIRDTPELIKEYFEQLSGFANRLVKFDTLRVRVFGNVATSSGFYKFSWQQGDSISELPSRYTIVFIKKENGWRIAEHHSSILPNLKK